MVLLAGENLAAAGLGLAAWAAACTAGSSPRFVPVRSPTECAEVVRRVLARPDAFPILSPVPERSVTAPRPVPLALRGTSVAIRVWVDEHGQPEPGSLVIERERDAEFVEYWDRLRVSVLALTFTPGVHQGCAVPALYSAVLEL